MIKIYESIENACPFDTSNTDMSYYNDLIDDNEKDYYKFSKDIEAEIIYMTPKEYMDKCTKDIFDGEDSYRGAFDDRVDEYADMMRDGKIFPMPVIEIQDNYIGQEGRHRMLAAGKAFGGDNKYPVLYVHNARITKDDMFNHLKKKYGKYFTDKQLEDQFKDLLAKCI